IVLKPAYSRQGVHGIALRISSVLQLSGVFRQRLPWLRLQGVGAPSLTSGGLPHQFLTKGYTRENCRALTEVNDLPPLAASGPKQRSVDVCYCAAVKGQADIRLTGQR